MRIPKKYGSYQVARCPFCDKQATAKSAQGVPVCQAHTKASLPDLKCQCGGYLDLREGKWGPYFNCFKCGNVNFSRALEMNSPISPAEADDAPRTYEQRQKQKKKFTPTETTVRSDELDFLY